MYTGDLYPLRLFAQPVPDGANLWQAPQLLLQKLPAPQFTATTRLSLKADKPGVAAGLLVMGADYAYIAVRRIDDAFVLQQVRTLDARSGSDEEIIGEVELGGRNEVLLRAEVGEGAGVRFSYSIDGTEFTPLGEPFQAVQGRWIGAKIGLFARREAGAAGYVDVDYFRLD